MEEELKEIQNKNDELNKNKQNEEKETDFIDNNMNMSENRNSEI